MSTLHRRLQPAGRRRARVGGMRAETGPLPARAPTPLDSMPLASDVRVDSAGRLVGSLVGEGTGTAVTLLSSDTLLIRILATRFRPELTSGEGDLWSNLRRQDSVPSRSGPRVSLAPWSALHWATPTSRCRRVLLRGNRCTDDTRGARLELMVQPDSVSGDPAAPRSGARYLPRRRPGRPARARAGPARAARGSRRRSWCDQLIGRTSAYLDSALTAEYPDLQARPLHSEQIEVNTLADLSAADVIRLPRRRGADPVRRLPPPAPRPRRARYPGHDRRDGVGQRGDLAPGDLPPHRARLDRRPARRPSGRSAGRSTGVGCSPSATSPMPGPISGWSRSTSATAASVGIIQPAGNVVVAAAEVEGWRGVKIYTRTGDTGETAAVRRRTG